jgi:uncharacterized protein with NRDE domain
MCVVALAIDQSRRFPLVLAANRDEFHDRPTQRLGWWAPADGQPDLLGGRDLRGGGAWLGLNTSGRLALVTNVRHGLPLENGAPSRGEIVPLWLRGDLPMEIFWPRVALSGHNSFNLLAADLREGNCFFASNEGEHPQRLQRGLYGLSNGPLDAPWPKVLALKARVQDALGQAESAAALAGHLFEALADPQAAMDDELPRTGVPLEWERTLSAAFVQAPERRYGTRCSTVVVTERIGRRLVTHVIERSFDSAGSVARVRQTQLRDWPPRASASAAPRAQVLPEVTEAEGPSSAPRAARRAGAASQAAHGGHSGHRGEPSHPAA